MLQKKPNIAEYTTRPALVLDFCLIIDAAKQEAGAFDISVIEKVLVGLKQQNFLVGGVHNRPEVGRYEETEQRYIAEVQFTLNQFKKNPFDWVKACYFDEEVGQGPFGRRSFLRLPDYGLLTMVEAEAWGAGISVDWGESKVVGLCPRMEQLARNAKLSYEPAELFFAGS